MNTILRFITVISLVIWLLVLSFLIYCAIDVPVGLHASVEVRKKKSSILHDKYEAAVLIWVEDFIGMPYSLESAKYIYDVTQAQADSFLNTVMEEANRNKTLINKKLQP